MYYVDKYLYEIVKEKDSLSPPERYYEYRKGIDGIIKETYVVSYNPLKLIDFAYAVDEDRSLISTKRNNHFEKHGAPKNLVLYAYTVPPDWYNEQVSKID